MPMIEDPWRRRFGGVPQVADLAGEIMRSIEASALEGWQGSNPAVGLASELIGMSSVLTDEAFARAIGSLLAAHEPNPDVLGNILGVAWQFADILGVRQFGVHSQIAIGDALSPGGLLHRYLEPTGKDTVPVRAFALSLLDAIGAPPDYPMLEREVGLRSDHAAHWLDLVRLHVAPATALSLYREAIRSDQIGSDDLLRQLHSLVAEHKIDFVAEIVAEMYGHLLTIRAEANDFLLQAEAIEPRGWLRPADRVDLAEVIIREDDPFTTERGDDPAAAYQWSLEYQRAEGLEDISE